MSIVVQEIKMISSLVFSVVHRKESTSFVITKTDHREADIKRLFKFWIAQKQDIESDQGDISQNLLRCNNELRSCDVLIECP